MASSFLCLAVTALYAQHHVAVTLCAVAAAMVLISSFISLAFLVCSLVVVVVACYTHPCLLQVSKLRDRLATDARKAIAAAASSIEASFPAGWEDRTHASFLKVVTRDVIVKVSAEHSKLLGLIITWRAHGSVLNIPEADVDAVVGQLI